MEEKINSLINQIEAKYGLDLKDTALIVTSKNNRLYFSGLNSTDGTVVITKASAYLLIDFRYFEVARKVVKHLQVTLITDVFESLRKILKKHEIKNALIENEFVSLSKYKRCRRFLNNLNVNLLEENILSPAINDLRMIKTQSEIKKIKTAQEIAELAFNRVINEIKIGMTEKEIAARLDYIMIKNGAMCAAFDTIVVSGENSSLPHGTPSNKKIEKGDFLLIDMGANFEGYCSDMTRTLAVTTATQEQRTAYDIVLKAQNKALNCVRCGIKCKDIDAVARDVIEKSEYKGKFGHALGHGVGLDVHEGPTLSYKSEQILQKSMVVTIEPGIYIEGKFGIRTEDMVLVQSEGYDNFTNITKELIII
ncbi:MAG: aminopeptidase P family protein [Clostridia bacterium]|nr:aminopeptidase P family protein [Clostridia bacterium]